MPYRLQLVEEVIQQHALQHGAVAFLDDISSAPPANAASSVASSQRPPDSPSIAAATAMEEELPELHGPCDRFAAPPEASAEYAHGNHQPDHPDRHDCSAEREQWREEEEEFGQGEVSGPPAEEGEEPVSLDADPCGEAPAAGEPLPPLSLFVWLFSVPVLRRA